MIRSPFFYVGDKYKLIKQLKNIFPSDVDCLIEPFCGGGSVFLNIKAKRTLANDFNPWMIKLHNYLSTFKDNRTKFISLFESTILKYKLSASFLGILVPEDLKQKYKKTYYATFNKEAYVKIREEFNNDKTDLMKLYILLIYGFNHMLRFNGKGDFNLPVGNVDYNKNVYTALNTYFDFIDKHDTCFYNYDFEDFLEKIQIGLNDVVYLDPPYLISNCEYNKGWTQESDDRLYKAIDKLSDNGKRFILSNVFSHKGVENKKLIQWSKKYNIYFLTSNYISYHDNTIKPTIEVVITNF